MVLAAHRTPVRGRLVATTVETVRFTRPDRVDFRLTRGPVPHVVEQFLLTTTADGTRLEYTGELGTDLWAVGARSGGTRGRTLGTHGPGDVRRGQGRSRTPQPRAGEGHPPLGRQGAGRRVRPPRCGVRGRRCRARRRGAGRCVRGRRGSGSRRSGAGRWLARFSGKIEVCRVHRPAVVGGGDLPVEQRLARRRGRGSRRRRRPRSRRRRRSSRGWRPGLMRGPADDPAVDLGDPAVVGQPLASSVATVGDLGLEGGVAGGDALGVDPPHRRPSPRRSSRATVTSAGRSVGQQGRGGEHAHDDVGGVRQAGAAGGVDRDEGGGAVLAQRRRTRRRRACGRGGSRWTG